MKLNYLDEIDKFARVRAWMIDRNSLLEGMAPGQTPTDWLESLIRGAESRNAPGVSFAELRTELARQLVRNEIEHLRNTVAHLERMVALLATESADRRGVAVEDQPQNKVYAGSRIEKSEKPAPGYAVSIGSGLGSDVGVVYETNKDGSLK